MDDATLPSERHYRFHLRRMGLGFAFSVAMAVATVVALLRPGSQLALIMAPAMVFFLATFVLRVALRGGRWREPDNEDRRIRSDERVRQNADRSRKFALLCIYAVQVPLILLVAYAPPEPSSVETTASSMALLTMACGSAAFFGSYLRHSWRDAHG